ncbi:MAG: nucleoside transport protein [Francisella sp.]|jgi:nucleoside transport protein
MILTKFLYFLLGLTVVFVMAFAWSSDRKNIKYKTLVLLLVIQLILAVIMLESSIGVVIVNHVSQGFANLLEYAHVGTAFIFGDLANSQKNGFVFFFNVGMSIVLISAIIGILQYFKILPAIIKSIGFILSKITGMGRLESFNAVSSLMVGQQENFLVYKKIIGHLPSNILYTMAATAMSSISLAAIAIYISIIDPRLVCVAVIINMFGIFFVLNIINPYEKSDDSMYSKLHSEYEETNQSFFEVLSEYILDGFKVAVIICAMLIGFVALLAMIDGIFTAVFGISFREVLGYLLYPFAWALNIHGHETYIAAQIMGTKIVANELVAMQMLNEQAANLSAHTRAVISVFLVSFASLSSIGIIIGAVQALSKEASAKIAKFGLKIIYGSLLVSFLSANIVGLII